MDQIVQGTNDSSTLSKYSMVNIGYCQDEYIEYFVHRDVRRSPLINIGYYVRSHIITTTLKYFLNNIKDIVQIVSLGAGFDTTFFRLTSEYDFIKYFEIDLHDVVRKKVQIIKNNDDLLKKIDRNSQEYISIGKECDYILSSKYCIFSQDLNNLTGLEEKMRHYGFHFDKCTIFFSECSITYLDAERCTQLIGWAKRTVPRSTFLTYEQINPDDAFGRIMMSHFVNIQSPLKSVCKYRTIEEQVERYFTCGWPWCKGISVMDLIYNLWQPGELWEILKKEPFDEFEELILKCCHYALIVACSSEFPHIWDKYVNWHEGNFLRLPKPQVFWEPHVPAISVQRFGHTSAAIDDRTILVMGGFGIRHKKHIRMNDVLQVDLAATNNTTCCCLLDSQLDRLKEEPIWGSMHSSSARVSNNEFLLYGGRTSPIRPVNTKPCIFRYHKSDGLNGESCTINPLAQVNSVISDIEPCPRWRHSAVVLSPGKVLIYGGITKGLEVLNDLWSLTLSSTSVDIEGQERTSSWSLLDSPSASADSPQPPPSCSHSAAVHKDIMYIAGGMSTSLRPLKQLWSFTFQDGWKEIKTEPEMKPRFGHTSHITKDNKLLLIGGVNASCEDQPHLVVICLKTLTLIEYQILPNSPEYGPLMVHNHASTYCPEEDSIYIIGGGGNCFSFGTYFNPNVVRICLKK